MIRFHGATNPSGVRHLNQFHAREQNRAVRCLTPGFETTTGRLPILWKAARRLQTYVMTYWTMRVPMLMIVPAAGVDEVLNDCMITAVEINGVAGAHAARKPGRSGLVSV